MHIKSIRLSNFVIHKSTHVVLPSSGVVEVVGKNGHGKSLLTIESVSAALWGKTMRGPLPWVDGEDSFVEIETDLAFVRRGRTDGKNWLSWSEPGQPVRLYETVTKGQKALEPIIGGWDEWLRSGVFSSRDASLFTLATDAERKRFLEGLLGIDRFDRGLAACRADIRDAEDTVRSARSKISGLRESLKQQIEMLEHAKLLLEVAPPSQAAAEKGVVANLGETREAHSAMMKTLARLDRVVWEKAAEVKATKRALSEVASGECPTCHQEIPSGLLERLQAAVETAQTNAQHVERAVSLEREDILSDVREFDQELEQLRSAAAAARAREDTAVAAKRARDKAAATVALAQAQMRATQANIELLEKDEIAKMVHSKTLSFVEKALGLGGARATMLDDALAFLQAKTNEYLAEISGQISCRIFRDAEEGGTVALEIVGAGGTHGYRGCSTGEQRRIDVAVLFALGELVAASRSRPPGTLVVDELFDSLDSDGVQAVAGLLNSISTNRCVVVVTHSDALHQDLRPVVRWSVSNGVVLVEPCS